MRIEWTFRSGSPSPPGRAPRAGADGTCQEREPRRCRRPRSAARCRDLGQLRQRGPCAATRDLFAVTTGSPRSSARRTMDWAGSTPPNASTTTSMPASRSASASDVTQGMCPATSRWREGRAPAPRRRGRRCRPRAVRWCLREPGAPTLRRRCQGRAGHTRTTTGADAERSSPEAAATTAAGTTLAVTTDTPRGAVVAIHTHRADDPAVIDESFGPTLRGGRGFICPVYRAGISTLALAPGCCGFAGLFPQPLWINARGEREPGQRRSGVARLSRELTPGCVCNREMPRECVLRWKLGAIAW